MAFIINDHQVMQAIYEKAKEINADYILYGVSDMYQYHGHITNIYFMKNDYKEIASISGLSLESSMTIKELVDSITFYNRQWGASTIACYKKVNVEINS